MLPILSRFSIFDDMFNDSIYQKKESSIMKTDIKENEENYILDIDLPGYSKENVKLELDKGYLTINAEISNEINDSDTKPNYLYKERFYGKASRTFYIGESIVDKDVKASFKNGILTVTFPKKSIKEESGKTYIDIND